MPLDIEPKVIVGSIEVRRTAGGYGLFSAHTGERLQYCKRHVWLSHLAALKAAKRLEAQMKARDL